MIIWMKTLVTGLVAISIGYTLHMNGESLLMFMIGLALLHCD